MLTNSEGAHEKESYLKNDKVSTVSIRHRLVNFEFQNIRCLMRTCRIGPHLFGIIKRLSFEFDTHVIMPTDTVHFLRNPV